MTASRAKKAKADDDRLLDTPALAVYLDVPEETIAWWRRQGTGPAYIKLNGRLVRYEPADVAAWLKSQKVGAA